MWSSTASTASTIPIGKDWCKLSTSSSSSSEEKFAHDCGYFCPKEQFDETLLRKLTRPISLGEKKQKDNRCEGQELENHLENEDNQDYLHNFLQKELNKNCSNMAATRLRLRAEANERKECVEKFLKSSHPWYIPREKLQECRISVLTNYNYPRICVELDNDFNDYRQIIKYFVNGIDIFLIDLQYNSQRNIIKIWNRIERARQILENEQMRDILIAVGFRISSRRLRTGLVKKGKDVFIDMNSEVILTAKRKFSNKCSNKVIYVNFANYIDRFQKDDVIEIGQKLKVKVSHVYAKSLLCRTVHEGLLESKMIVKIPIERSLDQIDITIEEEEDILFVMNLECDFVVSPCPNISKLAQSIRWNSMVAKHRQIMIFANIDLTAENFTKRDIDMLVMEYTGIWLNFVKYGKFFEYLMHKCSAHHRPVIRSLLMESEKLNYTEEEMKNTFLYLDCISVPQSGGVDPIKVKSIIKKNYPQMNEDELFYYRKFFIKPSQSIEYILLHYIATMPLVKSISCIIVCNNSSKSVTLLARKRPQVPIITSNADTSIARSLLLYKNVFPVPFFEPGKMSWVELAKKKVNSCVDYGKIKGFIKRDQPFVILCDSRQGLRYSDLYKIVCIE